MGSGQHSHAFRGSCAVAPIGLHALPHTELEICTWFSRILPGFYVFIAGAGFNFAVACLFPGFPRIAEEFRSAQWLLAGPCFFQVSVYDSNYSAVSLLEAETLCSRFCGARATACHALARARWHKVVAGISRIRLTDSRRAGVRRSSPESSSEFARVGAGLALSTFRPIWDRPCRCSLHRSIFVRGYEGPRRGRK